MKNNCITPECANIAKELFVTKYMAKGEDAFTDYFINVWLKKKFTYTEMNTLLPGEDGKLFHSSCVPPQSNAIERQNLTQKMVCCGPART